MIKQCVSLDEKANRKGDGKEEGEMKQGKCGQNGRREDADDIYTHMKLSGTLVDLSRVSHTVFAILAVFIFSKSKDNNHVISRKLFSYTLMTYQTLDHIKDEMFFFVIFSILDCLNFRCFIVYYPD